MRTQLLLCRARMARDQRRREEEGEDVAVLLRRVRRGEEREAGGWYFDVSSGRYVHLLIVTLTTMLTA